ncbi:ribonuclease III, partial [Patescibacteria group bacterium]
DFLFKQYPKKPEGDLTHLRAKIVQTKTLANTATKLQLGENLILSKGEKRAGGHKNISLLADVFEAVVGAIYLDQGLESAQKFIHQNLLKNLATILKDTDITDYKSKLQEKYQKKLKLTPTYKLIKTSGPDHHKIFEVSVNINRKKISQGKGKSKQEAQQQAAKAALEKKTTI